MKFLILTTTLLVSAAVHAETEREAASHKCIEVAREKLTNRAKYVESAAQYSNGTITSEMSGNLGMIDQDINRSKVQCQPRIGVIASNLLFGSDETLAKSVSCIQALIVFRESMAMYGSTFRRNTDDERYPPAERERLRAVERNIIATCTSQIGNREIADLLRGQLLNTK